MKFEGVARQLADYMMQLSEKYYADEWMLGIDIELWNEVQGQNDLLTPDELEKLKALSAECNGWVTMNLNNDNLEFLSLDRWQRKLKSGR